MVTGIFSVADRMLTLARVLDKRLASATIEQARQAVLANERRHEPPGKSFNGWATRLATTSSETRNVQTG